MTYETIDLDVRDGVAHLTLNRPDAANGINLATSWPRRWRSPTTPPRAVLLTGAGSAFCGGGDLKSFAGRDDLPTHLREILGPLHTAITELVRGDAPVVAAVQGSAAGAGIGLVGASDLVLAGESAKFVMAYTGDRPHPRRLVELVPAPPRRPPPRARAHAHQPRALGRRGAGVGAHHQRGARRLARRRGGALAARLADGPARPALAAAKRLLHTSLESTLETHLAREAEGISAATGDGRGRREGIAACSSRSARRCSPPSEPMIGERPSASRGAPSRVERGAVVVELRPQRGVVGRRGCAPRAARRCGPCRRRRWRRGCRRASARSTAASRGRRVAAAARARRSPAATSSTRSCPGGGRRRRRRR